MGLTTKPLMRLEPISQHNLFLLPKKASKNFEALSKFAVWTGLEPATPCVTGRYSNQLNYQTSALLRLQIYTTFLFNQKEYIIFLKIITLFFDVKLIVISEYYQIPHLHQIGHN